MQTPTCPACGPDYLRITEFTPASIEHFSIRTAQGTIRRPRHESPVAQFYCRKCGASNGYTVPDDWKPTPERQTNDEILNEFGVVWISRFQRKAKQPGGGLVIEHR